MNSPPPFQVNELFRDWSVLRSQIEEWAVKDRFAFKVRIKDSQRVDYICRTPECQWRVFASHNRNKEIQLKILNERHICIGRASTIREVHNSQSWLWRNVPEHLFVTRDTTTRQIIDILQLNYGVTVNTEAARLARASLVNDRIEHQQEQFLKIPAYLELLRQRNPWIHTLLHTVGSEHNPEAQHFQRVFICPAESQLSFIQMRPFVALDGTFLKARFVQTLLLAVGIDGNGQNLILAWGVVESENTDSWTWFLERLKRAIPQVLEATFISDRDKGLMAADHVLGKGINRLICCFHLHQNFKRFRNVEHLFWPIAKAKSEEDFYTRMHQLQQISQDAANYLEKIDKAMWADAFAQGKSYGHKTSNVVESTNNFLKFDREMSILDMLNEIWHKTMDLRYKRYLAACNTDLGQRYTDFAMKAILCSREWSKRNIVRIATRHLAEVIQGNDKSYTVNLGQKTCSCSHFQQNDIPCGHAYSFILALNCAPRDFMPTVFLITTWKNTYSQNIQPISLAEVDEIQAEHHFNPGPICHPPLKLRSAQGRPRNHRLVRGAQRKQTARAQAVLNLEAGPPERGRGSQQCSRCAQ